MNWNNNNEKSHKMAKKNKVGPVKRIRDSSKSRLKSNQNGKLVLIEENIIRVAYTNRINKTTTTIRNS